MNLQTINNRKSEKGFTIVELLIVIVVIAILAAISIVAYTGIQNRARDSAAEQLASQVAGKARAYHAIEGLWPTGLASGEFTPTLTDGGNDANLEGATVVTTAADPAATTDTAYRNGTEVRIQFGATGNDAPTVYYRSGTGSSSINL